MNTSSLARAHGEPLCRALIKNTPADFHVSEELDVAFSGDGEHLWLRVEKIGLNTAEVVDALAAHFSVKAVEVGYSGMKDKQAVTEQWFSVCTADDIAVGQLAPSMNVIAVQRHSRKLRHGTHDANRFRIILRDIEWIGGAGPEVFTARLQHISSIGFPNYLGPQRFGFGGQNLKRAEALFRQPKKRVSRQQRSLYLSAARSGVFNAVCDARVRAGSWDRLLEGEPLVLEGSRSFFTPDVVDEAVLERYQDNDVHPSAPWWGRGESLAKRDCAAFEESIMVIEPWRSLCRGLEQHRLDQDRRALRSVPNNLDAEWLSDTSCALEFSLKPGVFATMMLHELLEEITR